ncbi:hypothetical protein ACH4NG_12210 [Streptomyces bobili]|uniref:hypothetical protein n=1 Tax=Streptomyces bobili TaxID=67280 RepID=UPI00379DD5C0
MSARGEEPDGEDTRERHEPYASHDPTTAPKPPAQEPRERELREREPRELQPHERESHEQEPKQPHAGNGTVNHHLDDQSPEGLDSDELALRRMLHQAVQEMEPVDGTLDHLRRAVPARRARKRQAAVGMAAAALFVGTAVPALLHVSNSGGSDANPSIAGQASQAQGGADAGKGPDGGSSGKIGDSAGTTGSPDPDSTGDTAGQKDSDSATGAVEGTDPAATSQADAPACTPSQLGDSSAAVDVPDAAGIVYGTFRVVNVSDSGCTVGGGVSVTAGAQGAADPAKISLVEHTSGDAAAGLPDPSLYVSQLVLAPGSAYDVKFAWVPSETCPADGGSGNGGDTGGPSSSPAPSPSEQSSATSGTTGGVTGTAPQLFTADGTVDGGVLVTYTADGGSPTASATVSNACAGTVYRTGVLASTSAS